MSQGDLNVETSQQCTIRGLDRSFSVFRPGELDIAEVALSAALHSDLAKRDFIVNGTEKNVPYRT